MQIRLTVKFAYVDIWIHPWIDDGRSEQLHQMLTNSLFRALSLQDDCLKSPVSLHVKRENAQNIQGFSLHLMKERSLDMHILAPPGRLIAPLGAGCRSVY
jgi:hypothetical protein